MSKDVHLRVHDTEAAFEALVDWILAKDADAAAMICEVVRDGAPVRAMLRDAEAGEVHGAHTRPVVVVFDLRGEGVGVRLKLSKHARHAIGCATSVRVAGSRVVLHPPRSFDVLLALLERRARDDVVVRVMQSDDAHVRRFAAQTRDCYRQHLPAFQALCRAAGLECERRQLSAGELGDPISLKMMMK